jgi:leucyl aminopeptidase
MSAISIKKLSTLPKSGNIFYIFDKTPDWNVLGLTKEEQAYTAKKLEKKDAPVLAINQYNRWVYLYKASLDLELYILLEKARKVGSDIASRLNAGAEDSLTLIDHSSSSEVVAAIAEGIALGNYQFAAHINKKKDFKANTLKSVGIFSKELSAERVEQVQIVVDATLKARDLVNEPVNFLNAVQLAKEAEKLGKAAGFKTEVLDKKKIQSLKMGGLISVNLGSIDPPTFTIMEYKPKGATNKKPIVLVGKGVVYDTGGISLKPTASMDTMKCDMGGAAAVIGTMYAIASAKLKVHAVGLVPATDNRPDGKAYVPGDIITISDGTTIEVLNTDAEGRLILADALVYAQQYKPELVIDLATLTGAAAIAIGKYGTVMMGTASEEQKSALKKSGNNTYERLVEFPFWDEFADLLKSEIADMKNIGGPIAGSITAGKFLQHFTNYPYIHLDIAGPAFIDSKEGYLTKGGTGVGVRLLFDFLKNYKAN